MDYGGRPGRIWWPLELTGGHGWPCLSPHSPPPHRSPQMRRLTTCKWTRRRRRRCRAPCRSGLTCGSPRSPPRAPSSSTRGGQLSGQISSWFSQLCLGWIPETVVCRGEGVFTTFFLLRQKRNLISGEDLADTVCRW